MTPDYKASWVRALRSERYKQGRTTLKQVGLDADGVLVASYCCMGVLCKVNGLLDEHGSSMGENEDTSYDYLSCHCSELFGLSGFEQQLLADMNDVKKCTFDEIATYIEEHL